MSLPSARAVCLFFFFLKSALFRYVAYKLLFTWNTGLSGSTLGKDVNCIPCELYVPYYTYLCNGAVLLNCNNIPG